MIRVAVLDDYPGIALEVADWSPLKDRAAITVFDRHLSEIEAATVLEPFEVLCTMRERMVLDRELIASLPRLKLITATGPVPPTIDLKAASARGILVSHGNLSDPAYGAVGHATPELAWGLVIDSVRGLARDAKRMRDGDWQGPSSLGTMLHGRTLGLLGLGRIGRRMAEFGRVFGMDVIAWSQNLTAEAATDVGVTRVSKDDLFARSDVLSIHVRLSDRTHGLVGARELALMRPSATLINTSRGPIVEGEALLAALKERRIAHAGLDVFDQEPLPADHPLRHLDNVTLTPHLGYVTRSTMALFYRDTVDAILGFLDGSPRLVASLPG